MRELLTTLLELAGIACIVAGAAMIATPLAWILGGVSLVIVGVTVSDA